MMDNYCHLLNYNPFKFKYPKDTNVKAYDYLRIFSYKNNSFEEFIYEILLSKYDRDIVDKYYKL